MHMGGGGNAEIYELCFGVKRSDKTGLREINYLRKFLKYQVSPEIFIF